jgi:pimeloyl-ACP methyl ester carboxylesterase
MDSPAASLASKSAQLLADKRTWIAAGLLVPTALYAITQLLASSNKTQQLPKSTKIHRAPPRHPTLSELRHHETNTTCPYPPDSLPNPRDINTPYGTIRSYEWGPPQGRKFLFIHGISTPCISLAALAQKLVETHGARVLLFDLFGRGYSDCPEPAEVPQDGKLWASQIAFVLGDASSRLDEDGGSGDWWGGKVTVVGYSLGGGIAVDFASWFPQAVEGLVLIAPAGLLRRGRVAFWSRVVYGGWLPRRMVEGLVGRRLVGGGKERQPEETKVGIVEGAEAERPDDGDRDEDVGGRGGLFPGSPPFNVSTSVAWQVDSHPGFVAAFISSIQNSPISGQWERWSCVWYRLNAQREKPDDPEAAGEGFREGKVLMLLGKDDSVIVADEIGVDAVEALGQDNVKVEVLEGGHDLPIAGVEACAKAIGEFYDWS